MLMIIDFHLLGYISGTFLRIIQTNLNSVLYVRCLKTVEKLDVLATSLSHIHNQDSAQRVQKRMIPTSIRMQHLLTTPVSIGTNITANVIKLGRILITEQYPLIILV